MYTVTVYPSRIARRTINAMPAVPSRSLFRTGQLIDDKAHPEPHRRRHGRDDAEDEIEAQPLALVAAGIAGAVAVEVHEHEQREDRQPRDQSRPASHLPADRPHRATLGDAPRRA